MQRSTRNTVAAGAVLTSAFVMSFAGLMAQGPPAANAPPKPLVPVAASSVYNTPDVYVNEYLTMTAAVEKNLSKTAFSVDQDKTKATGKEVLVIAPTLQKAADANTYVTVIGQMIKFDANEVAAKLKDYQIDLSPEDMARFQGKPVVLATSVIDIGGIDIAKKPIPPPTADDLTLAKQMTKLPGAQAALRKGVDGSDANIVKEQATIIKAAFAETQAFWKTKNNAEAMGIAAEGVKHADAVLTAAAAANWDGVKAALSPMGAVCGNCHGKYRERMEDGTFRIKAGSF
jgi:cytochrome c556